MILPVIVAALASWLFGAVWYGLLSKPWMAAKGMTAADTCGPDGKKKSPLVPMAVSFIGELVMAAGLKLLLPVTIIAGTGDPILDVLAVAGLIWLSFVFTTITVNNAFSSTNRTMLTVIDSGHWLCVLLIQSLVLGFWSLHY